MAAMDSRDQTSPRPKIVDFATTRWSIVRSAGRDSSPVSKRALASLCETYWYSLYAYARRRASDVHEAQDLTQAFFAELLEKNYLASANPDRGRFRSFLLTAFKNFLAKYWDRARAQKRGGGRAPISLDFVSADSSLRIEMSRGLTAEQHYDRQWAFALLAQIMERLRTEVEQVGNADRFASLKDFIIGDQIGVTYAQVAEQLQITEVAARKAASRMRKRYGELLHEEILHTVSEPDDVQDEIRNLFAALEL